MIFPVLLILSTYLFKIKDSVIFSRSESSWLNSNLWYQSPVAAKTDTKCTFGSWKPTAKLGRGDERGARGCACYKIYPEQKGGLEKLKWSLFNLFSKIYFWPVLSTTNLECLTAIFWSLIPSLCVFLCILQLNFAILCLTPEFFGQYCLAISTR